jgi:hypothetical protein
MANSTKLLQLEEQMLNGFTKGAAPGFAGLTDPTSPNAGPIEFEVASSDLHSFER